MPGSGADSRALGGQIGAKESLFPLSRNSLRLFAVMLPVLLQAILIGERLVSWRPMWAWYPDPGYQYLLSGGSVITGGSSDMIYHPGTSLLWIVGFAEWLGHLITGVGDFRTDLVARPEYYAQWSSGILGLLFVTSLAAAAWRLLRTFGLGPALVFQLLMLWALPLTAAGRYVLWPESLLLTSAVAALAVLAPQLSGQIPRNPMQQAVGLAAISAVGLTGKILYLPMIILTLIFLRRRQLAVFMCTLIGSVVIIMVPMYGRLKPMADWFIGITFNPGRHGQSGSWNPADSLMASIVNVQGLLRWFIPLILTALIIVLWAFINPGDSGRKMRRTLAAILLGLALALAAGLKAPELRDFILVAPLVSLLVAVLLAWAARECGPTIGRVVLVGGVLLATFLGAHGVVGERYMFQASEVRTQRTMENAAAIGELNQAGVWAPGYGAWTLESSLVFGLMWSDGEFNEEVHARYPRATHYQLWDRRIMHVDDLGRLRPLSCPELESRIRSGEVGIVVESPNHLAFEDDGRVLQLETAKAAISGMKRINDLYAYRLKRVTCF